MDAAGARFGTICAVASLVFSLMFSVVAVVGTFTMLLSPDWVNFWSFLPSLFLAWSFVAALVCLAETAPPPRRVFMRLAIAIATVYVAINSIVYFSQLTVILPATMAGAGASMGPLVFGPKTFMLAINGLAYGLMSLSVFVGAFAFPGDDAKFLRRAMLAHGLLAPVIAGAVLIPWLTYIGALWIVTYPVMAGAMAGTLRRWQPARH